MIRVAIACVFVTSLATTAYAKGPILHGTFASPSSDGGESLSIDFVAVNIPGTTTRVAGCNFDEVCESVDTKKGACPTEDSGECAYLRDVVITAMQYFAEGTYQWQLDYAYIDESGFVVPFFSVKTIDPEGLDGILVTIDGTEYELQQR